MKIGIDWGGTKIEGIVLDPQTKNEMITLSNGRTTVPQIFFGENHIGGYDDLKRCYDEGKLSLLLKNEN